MDKLATMANYLYFGDNLTVMRERMQPNSVDLIYLDPPFNSKRNYNIFFDSSKNMSENAQIVAFKDMFYWEDETSKAYDYLKNHGTAHLFELLSSLVSIFGRVDLTAYLVMMAIRLQEMYRILKPTGSLYLHCDPTAGHYIKIVLDIIFGGKNFRNNIVWKRTSAHNDAKRWGHIADFILFYTKSENYTWNNVYTEYNKDYIDKFYRHKDKDARIYRVGDLTAAGLSKGESGQAWRGVNPSDKNRHWAISRDLLNDDPNLPDSVLGALDYLDSIGRIYWPEKGEVPGFIRYLDEMPGVNLQEIVTDIPPLSARGREKLGYPTQKPLVLLERILAASSNKGDVIFDPFCGCGTTIEAAHKLEREWIGIDISYLAVNLVEQRLKDIDRLGKWSVVGAPVDLRSAENLAIRDRYQFQYWACSLVKARPYNDQIKGADHGIDGKIFFNDDYTNLSKDKVIIVSVKSGKNVDVSMLRDLVGTVVREGAAMGLFVTLVKPTKPMVSEAYLAGYYESPGGTKYQKIQIMTIEELLLNQGPSVPIDITCGAGTFKKARGSGVKYKEALF
jgi:site-specific DNA-methyltransferase (adenine-specific)